MSSKFLHQIPAILIGLALICILGVIITLILYVPQMTARLFGDADPNLDSSQRFLYSLYLLINHGDLENPSGVANKETIFIIHSGEPASEISKRLMESGWIPNSEAFNIYLKYKGLDRKIQMGIYYLSPAYTPLDIANLIHDADPERVKFSILPGWRAEEIAALIPSSGLNFSASDFLDIVRSPGDDFSNELNMQPETLEGFLYPSSYNFLRTSSAENVIKEMVLSFFTQLPIGYEDKVKGYGLSLYDAIILASIIQKEAVVVEEAPLIAGVFINRIKTGMPLQSDPTVQYALGFAADQQSWWKNPLTSQDLRVDSPYNTYIHNGLPPAPICNPGTSALLSVANPEITDYFYFRSVCDGSGLHIFSRTYEEHLQAVCK